MLHVSTDFEAARRMYLYLRTQCSYYPDDAMDYAARYHGIKYRDLYAYLFPNKA